MRIFTLSLGAVAKQPHLHILGEPAQLSHIMDAEFCLHLLIGLQEQLSVRDNNLVAMELVQNQEADLVFVQSHNPEFQSKLIVLCSRWIWSECSCLKPRARTQPGA